MNAIQYKTPILEGKGQTIKRQGSVLAQTLVS